MAGSIHQDKRTGKWFYTLELGKHPVTGKRQQRKRSGFKNKTEARKAMVEAEKEFNEGELIDPSDIKFSQFLNDWLETKKLNENIGKQTAVNYRNYINNHIIPAIGHLKLSELKTSDIQNKLVNKMSNNSFSGATIRKAAQITKTALEHAVNFDMIKKNPAKKIILPKTKKQNKEFSVWSEEQSNEFLRIAKTYSYYTAFYLALNTGMRQQEVLALRWKDIDFEKNTLEVNQVLTHDGKDFLDDTKTESSQRTIHLSQSTIKVLKMQKNKINKEKLKLGKDYQDSDLVVCSELGTPIIPRNLLRAFYSIIKKADLPNITFHGLRHTHASLLLSKGINIKLISERLGHSSVKITLDIYSHILPSMQTEVVNVLDEMMGNK